MDERVPTVKAGNWGHAGSRMVFLLLTLGLIAGFAGCTRAFYRKAADKEVNDILAEKDKNPEWKIDQYHVYPDPRARFADPTNPDRPPMPADDPGAWDLSPHPQNPGHGGVGTVEGTAYLEMIKTWDNQNRTERQAAAGAAKQDVGSLTKETKKGVFVAEVDNRVGPLKVYFDEPLSAKEKGYLLTLDQTVELGLINSRTYQNFREELYETALPVTQQRFNFAYQWAVIENAVRQWAGPLFSSELQNNVVPTVGQQNSWSLNTTASFSKLFSTGALLTFAFANNTVFNFNSASPFGFTSASNINLNLVQPLLQGGGKAVTLEPLTQAERSLVYAIRAFARFRKQFFVSVAIGTTLPSDLPTAAGTSNLSNPISTLAALGIASTDVSGGFVGYLSTLYREVDMAVDKKWVSDLEKAVHLFEGLQEGGQVSPLQVEQVRSTLLQAKNSVLTDQQFVTNALDQFKLVLGMPANLPLILDDVTARTITRQLDRYYEVMGDADAAYKLIEQQDQVPPAKLRAFLLETYTRDQLVRGMEFQKKLPASWAAWVKLKDQDLKARIQKLGQARRQLLDTKTELEMKGKTLSPNEDRSLKEAEFEADLGSLEEILRRYEAQPWAKLPTELQRRLDRTKLFRLVAYQAEIVLVYARNERFEHVGELWPALLPSPLEDIDLITAESDKAQEVAVQFALKNRLDLMNARAQVVDAWRQLAVTANALLGVLNVSYNLDSATPQTTSNPLAFATNRTASQILINAQLPLVRVTQRNNYRIALINYQQARRSLMNLEDNIAAQVRFDVRQLHLFGENYKIQKSVIQSLYSQLENALEVIVAPVDPDQLKQTGTTGQANAAALTSQYLSALSSLNGQQTKMYDIWLSFQATRMELYQDLELLPLDNRGVWIDESGNPADLSHRASGSAVPVHERGAALGEPLAEPGPLPSAARTAVE